MEITSFHKPTERLPQRNIIRFPELNGLLKNEKVEKIGQVPVVTANWGDFLSAGDFITNNRRKGLITGIEEEMIHDSGFTGGWRSPHDYDVYSDEGQLRQAALGAALAKRAILEHGWDGADVLALASVSSRIDTPEVTAGMLLQENIGINSTLFYGFACAGGTAAMCDLSRMSELMGKRVVVVALETLSGLQFDPKDIGTSWTFGNGGAAIAFQPGVDIIHRAGKTWVEKDDKMIRMPYPPIYSIPPESLPQESWPPWYTLVGEETAANFCFFRGGVVINQFTDEKQPRTGMSGIKTFKFFVGRFPERIVQFFRDNHFDEMNPAIIHQPSKPVLLGVQNKVYKIIEALRLQQGVTISIPEMPWLMDETEVNNVSAATAFFQMSQLIREGRLQLGIPTPVIGFGIGSVMHVDVVKFA